jgi:predicted DCC family thiol-disulfide oxidoreductase YuxK
MFYIIPIIFPTVLKPLIINIPDEIACRQPIVFFDGECSLCSCSVRFLLRHNSKGNLTFSSLQSVAGKRISALAGKTATQSPDTLLFLVDNKLFEYSTAVLKIAEHLSFPWKTVTVFYLIPAFLRDYVYRLVAKNRYRWFGKKPFCTPADKDYSQRILN